jgi:GTP cyclohydrolase II
MSDLDRFATRHDIKILRIADLIEYRKHERQIRRKSETVLPTRKAGNWRLMVYSDDLETTLYVALVKGEIDADKPTLTRLHSQCLTGDVFGSERCDCGPQLREAVERIAEQGGFLLYLRQEGRGIGLYAKLDAYALQDAGLDTYEANVALGRGEDERDYSAAAQMLLALGADRIRLLSNNPDKAVQLAERGIEVTQQIPTGVHMSSANVRYLATKASHTAHTIELPLAE